jgi:hypothetical protein
MAGAKQYDADKAEWVAATKEQEAHHEAVAEGKPLPGDRTEADMRRLEPGMAGAGPVLTANENTVDLDRAGAGGGRAAGTGRGVNPS